LRQILNIHNKYVLETEIQIDMDENKYWNLRQLAHSALKMETSFTYIKNTKAIAKAKQGTRHGISV
jgi:hypothetical protein